MAKGWRTFQLDLEGGLHSAETIAWAIDHLRACAGELVVRVPADDLPLLRKLARLGCRRFMVPGFSSIGELQAVVRSVRECSDEARIVAMVETAALMDAIATIARIEGVSGVHFGLVDLCRDMGVDDWRDVDQLPREVIAHAGEARTRGLAVGTYMLPPWRDTHWPRHFDVHSYVLSEFALPEVSASQLSQ
ncbi:MULTISPECIES: aldolase/citrate lyase family protein [unclassified Variovorax]|nr:MULTISPECIES: aldolase/citrate lyase family protein [unclassified Variovorax]